MSINAFGVHDDADTGPSLPANFPAVFCVVSPQGRLLRASDQWLALFKTSRDAALGQSLFDCIAPDTQQAVAAALEGETKQDSNLLCKLALPAQQQMSVTLTLSHLKNGHDAIFCLATPMPDDGLVKRLETKSRRLQSCLEGTNAGTWEWNVQTGETRFNERWAEIVGYRLKEFGKTSIQTWLDLAHPDDLARSSAALEAHWAGKTPYYDIEARMRHKDGHWVWVHDRGRVFTWTDDGAPEWMYGTHFSIDAQKEEEARAAQTQRLFERMEHMAGVGGWEVDLKTNQVVWTAETRRIHGVPDDFVPSVAEGISFYAPEARPTITAAVERGMQEGKAWDLELPFIRYDGSRIWVRAVGDVAFEDGKPVRLYGAFQDISVRNRRDAELRAAQDWMRLATTSGGVGLWSLDSVDGTVTWDATMASHFMVAPQDQPQTLAAWLQLLPSAEANKIKRKVKALISSQERMEVEVDFIGDDGKLHALKLTGQASLDEDGLLDRIQGTCFDRTAERQLMAELQEQTAKLTVTLSSIGDGVITTDRDRRITWINETAAQITGWTCEQAVGRLSDEVFAVFDEDSGDIAADPIRHCLQEGQVVALQPNAVLHQKTGQHVAVEDSAAPIIDANGRVIGAVLVFRDVTAQRRLSRDIAFRATHDQLTGALNRAEFEQRLQACLDDPVQKKANYLFFFDLDHFKRVNDTMGHDTGDKLLCMVSDVLHKTAGEGAHIARQGGDEFVILAPMVSDAAAQALAEKICAKIAKISITTERGDMPRSGASAGVVYLGSGVGDLSEYMRRADIAAYAAKEAGRGQVCIWSASDGPMQQAASQIVVAEQIEKAHADGAWGVYAQPITPIDLDTQTPEMRELLIRLPDGQGKLMLPKSFLGAAERYGMMQMIDLWMFRFCADHVAKDQGDAIYTINLSPSSVGSHQFQDAFMKIAETVAPATLGRICVEITETAVVQNFDIVAGFLRALRSRKMRVAIDDFGAGASSFRYFNDLPADYLKIDGSFIRNLDDPVARASVECFVKMAQVSDLQCIAEHVETDDVVPQLAKLGFDFVQGFAIAKPQPLV